MSIKLEDDASLEAELLSDSGTGVKRPLDTPNSGPTAKKANISASLDIDTADKIVEEYPIPDQLVGLVIGRGGENIQRIQAETHCGIQVQAQSTGTEHRPCTLTGTTEQLEAAKQALEEVIANGRLKDEQNAKEGRSHRSRSGPRPSDRKPERKIQQGPPPMQHTPQPWQQATEEFLVSPDKVGVVIGKGGQNLKNMRTKYNVQLELVQKETDPTGVAKPLKITGTPQQIHAVRVDCFQAMLPKEEKTPQKLATGGQLKVEFPVPQGAVGVIIGKKGETISQLQGETTTRIQFKPEEPDAAVRGCYVTGTLEGVLRAQQIVMSICRKKMTGVDTVQNIPKYGPAPTPLMGPPQNGAPPMTWNQAPPTPSFTHGSMPMQMQHQMPPRPPHCGPEQTVDYPVPASKAGAVIGKGGEHIISIKNQSGCQITQNKTNPPSNDPQWRYFTIKGQPEGVALAQKLIQDKVGGPPPPGANLNGVAPATPPHQGMMPRPGYQPPYGAPPQMPPHMPQPPTAGPPQYPSPGMPPVVVQHGQHQQYQHPTPQYPPQAPPATAPPVQAAPVAQPQQSNDHYAAWAAYYQQLNQQQNIAPTPTPQPASQSPASQPDYTKAWEEYFKHQQANNTSSSTQGSSQPDYTAAWAEYYKTMGYYKT